MQTVDVGQLQEIDSVAALRSSSGKRGQKKRLQAELGREPESIDFDLDDADLIGSKFVVLMGSKLTQPSDFTVTSSPFDEECRTLRSVKRGESAMREARVTIMEHIWENPRRRRIGDGEHRLFARGGVWSGHAYEIPVGAGPACSRLLEHVVPAATVNLLIADLIRRHKAGNDEESLERKLVNLLSDVVRHVVLCKCEDKKYLKRDMSPEDVLALRQHFAGEGVLSEPELLLARWGRYLHVGSSGVAAFEALDLGVPK